MITGPSNRDVKTQRRYKQYLAHKPEGCRFCQVDFQDAQVLESFQNFWLTTNAFSYKTWDSQKVAEHLMIVPKRHVDSLSEFTKTEKEEYVELIAKYESLGYSLYARSVLNLAKSVTHQHTHLIKLADQHIRATLFVRKPHLVIHF